MMSIKNKKHRKMYNLLFIKNQVSMTSLSILEKRKINNKRRYLQSKEVKNKKINLIL